MQLKSFAIARAALTALILGASAQATILTETSNLPTWNAAVTSPVTQNFNAIGTSFIGGAAGIPLGGITYRGFYNESSSVGYDTYLYGSPVPGENLGSGGYMLGGAFSPRIGTGASPSDTGLSVNFGSIASINAISFNFSGWRDNTWDRARINSTAGTPINLTLQVYEGANLSIRTLVIPPAAGVPLNPVSGFFGFTTSGSISSIRLLISTPTNTDLNLVALDNLSYATIGTSGGGGEIPEPHTYLLCAAGLFGAALLRRKKN